MPKPASNYDKDFRQRAVDFLLSTGRPLTQVAKELGVSANSLRNWRNQALANSSASKPASSQSEASNAVPVADAVAEIRRLQREVDYLKRQREILKKAMSILGEDPQIGMR